MEPPTEPPGNGPTPSPIVTREPAPGFACESSDIDGLSFLDPGWHAGTEFKWNNIGCRGRYQLAAPSLVVECTADINGWMAYGINPPTTLEPNYEPDADPNVVYRLWMTNTIWFGNASGELTGYQLPWTYTSIFAQRSLATGTFHWSHNDQWYDGNDQLVYDTFHPRFVDTRTILNAQARSFAVGYLLFWPASDHNGAGAAFENVSLRGVGYCGV